MSVAENEVEQVKDRVITANKSVEAVRQEGQLLGTETQRTLLQYEAVGKEKGIEN
ncbi:MAG: hypothetical protein F6K11_28375 [Leptolyngbya sp. SIO3F4]|nr:hypothetical protein [Leptolyngbya sp. SIO3F4]